jgi:hypothetical protein
MAVQHCRHLIFGVQAELAADGVGDHIFLLRLAEMSCAQLRQDLAKTLCLNERAFAFALKVRGQLSALVKQRVWPIYVAGKCVRGKRARLESPPETAAACQVREHEPSAQRKPQGHRSGMPPCPSLEHGKDIATAQDIDRIRHALAIGYAPRIAIRMPSHNGYRTITARKPSVACDLSHLLLQRLVARLED